MGGVLMGLLLRLILGSVLDKLLITKATYAWAMMHERKGDFSHSVSHRKGTSRVALF
jgi:hypothetical protein